MAATTETAATPAPATEADLAASAPFLADDIWDCPDDGKRYEVIEGRLYVTTAPDLDHQRPITPLLMLIGSYVYEHDLGEVFTSPVGLILDERNGVQPDLVYVSHEREEILTDRGIRGVPDMVAEILSPSTKGRDRGIKLRRYAKSGIPHYWLLDPATRSLEAYELQGTSYVLTVRCAEGDVFRPTLFPGLEIPISRLWQRRRPAR